MTIAKELAAFPEGYCPHMTEEEFASWALRTETRAEWVEGEVILMSPVSWTHSDIVTFLIKLMGLYTEKNDLGVVSGSEFMNRFKESRRLPDVFFVAKGREGLIKETYLDGPADLVVEVVSRDSRTRDRRDK
jgi:Uma2 family endonuclease